VGAFAEHYGAIRRQEGRRVVDRKTLLALPFRDLTGRHAYEWRIRARSFKAFLTRVLRPLERRRNAPLRIADVGCGVGWLAYRLARRGHDVVAFDLCTTEEALGAHAFYPSKLLSVEAELDALPLPDATVDLVVYNASFHYAADAARALEEALRVLTKGGGVVVMDSPLYADGSSGEAMVRERTATGGGGHATIGFLTYDGIGALASELGLAVRYDRPWHGLSWWAKPHLARLRGTREPARFDLVSLRRIREP
jgi:SAM-dependent methyltransferase